jgi:hypothetical protein
MEEWLLEGDVRWTLAELTHKNQARAVVRGSTTSSGELQFPLYESEEAAWRAAVRREDEVVPVRLSPAVPPEE